MATLFRISRMELLPEGVSGSGRDLRFTLTDMGSGASKTITQTIPEVFITDPVQIANIICSNLDAEFFPNDIPGCSG